MLLLVRAIAADLVEISLGEEKPYSASDWALLIKVFMRAGKAYTDIGQIAQGKDTLSKTIGFWNEAKREQKDFAQSNTDVGFTLFCWFAKAVRT